MIFANCQYLDRRRRRGQDHGKSDFWDSDPPFALPLIAALAKDGFLVGNNEPYDGALMGDTLDEEVTCCELTGLLIEACQDLAATMRTPSPSPIGLRDSCAQSSPAPTSIARRFSQAGQGGMFDRHGVRWTGVRGRNAGIIPPCILTALGGGGIARLASKKSSPGAYFRLFSPCPGRRPIQSKESFR